jgi:hypothetical protein
VGGKIKPACSLIHNLIRVSILAILMNFLVANASAQQTTSVSSLLDGLGVPGIDSLDISGVTTGDGWTAGTTTLHGESVTIVVFTQAGFSDRLVAVLPANANLTSFLPVGSGTPLDDISFDDLAFIFVAGGESGVGIDTTSFPDALSSVLTDYGDTVDLKTGFNLFGTLDFSASGAMQSVLSSLGIAQASLPLNGDFGAALLSANPANMGAALKNQILSNLNIVVPLPGASIGHNAVSLTGTQIAIVSKDGGIDFDVTSDLSATLGPNTISMDIDIDTLDKTGGGFDVTISGSSTQTMSLDLFHSFDLSSLSFSATHSDSAWTWSVDAVSTLHGSPVDVSASSGDELTITTNMTLAALIDAPSTPGLDDINLTSITVKQSTIEVDTTVKGLGVDIFIYRPDGASHSNVGIVATSTFDLGTFVSAVNGTMADDATFTDVAMIWTPSTAAATGVDASSLPGALGTTVADSSDTVDLKAGLNIFGSMGVTTGGALASLLGDLNIPTTTSLPLNGTLSAQMFSSAASSVETDILNALDITIPLSNVSLSEGPASATLTSVVLKIKGDTSDGNKVDVNVSGDIGVSLDGTSVDMAMTLDYEHGASPDMTITGSTTTPITFDFFKSFDVASASFTATRADAKWSSHVNGTAELNGQNVAVDVEIKPSGDEATFTTTSTLAQLIGERNLPGLDDVTFSTVQIAKSHAMLKGDYKGHSAVITSFKRGPGNKTHVAINFPGAALSLASFVPQLSSTPIKDVAFGDLTFIWVPEGAAETRVEASSLPGVVGTTIASTGPTINLSHGLLINGYLDIGASPTFQSYMEDLGIPVNGQVISGTLGPSAMHPNLASAGRAIEDAILDNLDLHFNVAAPGIPGLDDVLSVTEAKISITGKLNAQNVRVIDAGVDLTASLKIGSHNLNFNVDFADVHKSNGTSELTMTSSSGQSWTNPMGIDWFSLDDIGLTITKTGGGNTATDWTVALASTIEIGGLHQEVTTDFQWVNGTLADASFKFDGPLPLSDIPGVKDLPNSSEFTISSLTVSTDGIEADTTLHGNALDFYAFKASGNWNVAVVQKDFEIHELIPELDNTAAGDFRLSEAAVMISDGGIRGALSSFPTIAQDALKNIYGSTSAEINIGSGLSLVAAYGAGGTSVMASGLKRMGGDGGVLVGTIGGVFGGTPDVSLQIELALGAKPQHNSHTASISDSVQLTLGVTLSGGPASFVGQVSTGVDVTVDIKGDTLVFGSTVALQISEEDVRVEYVMSLKVGNDAGKPLVWHKPYGIPGFELHSVTVAMGVDEEGGQHFGFAGDFTLPEQDTINFAVDFDLTPEALEFPSDLAFKGSATYLEMDYLQAVAFQMLESETHVDLGISKLPVPRIEGIMDATTGVRGPAQIAFVTPGAQDPNLGITSVGFGIKGSMHWLGQDLGDLSVSIGPTSGIFAWGDLGNIDLGDGLFEFKDNNFAMRIPMPGLSTFNSPVEVHSSAACKSQKGLLFCVNSHIDIIGIDEDIRVDATSEGMSFSASANFGKYFGETVQFALTGIDLLTTDPDLSKADFTLSGSLHADVGEEIEVLMKDGINSIFNGLESALATGLTDITHDRTKVDHLTSEINKQRAILRAAKQKVEGAVETAQRHVNEINGDLAHDWRKYHGCHGWGKYWCKARWGVTIGLEKGVRDAADGILDAAEALVSHVPIDLSPTVWPLILSRDTATSLLYLAEQSIKGLSDLDRWTTSGLDAVENFAGGAINVKHASFNGSLRGIIAHDDPVDMAIEVEMFGTTFSDNFAFKIGVLAGDVANDFKQLYLLAYLGIDHLFEKALADVPAPLKSQLRGAIGKLIDADQAANRRRLASSAAAFAHYAVLATELQSTYANFANSYAFSQMTQVVSPLDRLPASKAFTNDVIEVGNSGYCLTIPTENNSVGYDACAAAGQTGGGWWTPSIGDQEITTSAVMEPDTSPNAAEGATKDSGYVMIRNSVSQPMCLTVPGKWSNEEVTYGDMSAFQSVFHPTTQYSDPNGYPAWQTCSTATDNAEQNWKVLDHGERYFQIINRATQMCLYMKYPTNPEENNTTTLSMISCVGADTQVFKLAPVTPATHHLVGNVIKRVFQATAGEDYGVTINGQCLGQSSGYDGGNGNDSQPCLDNGGRARSLITSGQDKPNVHWNYFEDFLGRRRFEAIPTAQQIQNDTDEGMQPTFECLVARGQSGEANEGASYGTDSCNADQENQWFTYSRVVGGMALVAAQSVDFGQNASITTRFPDPVNILAMPLNPMAGAVWTNYQGGDYNSTPSGIDVAYKPQEQTNSAIAARASHWAAVKTALDANRATLAEGNQFCPSSATLCYMAGPPSPYVATAASALSTPWDIAASIPAGAVGLSGGMPVPGATSTSTSQGTTFAYLTDGTMIISDDMSASNAASVAAYPGTAPTEPTWFLCRSQPFGGNADGWIYKPYIPGVVENQLCVFAPADNYGNGYDYQTLTKAIDVFWQQGGGGYLPSLAVPVGRFHVNESTPVKIDEQTSQGSNLPQQALFSCRSMVNRKTYIGWTYEGEFCHVKYSGKQVVTRNFQVLTLNGHISEPLPTPPQCTMQDMQSYLNQYEQNQGMFGGSTNNQGYSTQSFQMNGMTIPAEATATGFYANDQYYCTPAQYNKQHPGCNYVIGWNSCQN